MTYAFVHAMGFEFKAFQSFDVATGDSYHYTTDTAGPWSRYAFHGEQTAGGDMTFSLPAGTAANNMWCNFNMKPITTQTYFDFHDDNGIRHLRLRRDVSGKIALDNGVSTQLALSTHVIDLNVWHSWALFMNIADASGQVILVVDGTEEINFTGDTRNAGNALIGQMKLITSGVAQLYIVDDIIFGTGTTADNPGTAKVYGLAPSGDGDVQQLLKSQLTNSRFYFPSGDPDGGSAGGNSTAQHDGNDAVITVTPDAGWNNTGSVKRRALKSSKLWDTYAIRLGSSKDTFTFAGLTTDDDLLMYQFISGPMAAFTLPAATTVKGQFQFDESDAAGNDRPQIIIRVVSNDGTTVRGTLVAIDTAAIGSDEFASGGSPQNRKTPRGGSVSVNGGSSFAVTAGDRLVVEIGSRHTAATTTQTLGAHVGSYAQSTNGSDLDLPEDQTTTAFNAPWIEFSNPWTFSTTVGNAELMRKFPAFGAAADNVTIGPDTTTVYETTVDKYDLYQFTNVSGFDTVLGVVVECLAKRTDAGSGTLQIAVKSGATESFGASQALGLGYTVVRRNLAQNPVGPAAWTPTTVNSLQAGYRIKA